MQIRGFDRSNRYARAFLNVWYKDGVPEDLLAKLKKLFNFLSDHRFVVLLLYSPQVVGKVRDSAVHELCSRFGLEKSFEGFVSIVLNKAKDFLLLQMVWHIIQEGMRRRGEQECEVTSSHELSSDKQKSLVEKFSKAVEVSLIPKFNVNPSLICGVRIKCRQFIWERSIARRLALFARSIGPDESLE
ncbi:FoF1 ATP synthase subunit delta [Candidatus Dependentiae bacterium]